MKHKILALTILPVAILSLSACTQSKPKSEVESLSPGRYTTTSSSKNSNGTDTKVERTLNVGVDANGNKVGTEQKRTTTDPKGLFNKNTSTSTRTVH